MNNETVLRAFLSHSKAHTPTRIITNGIYQYKGQTLTTDGEKLWNYNTIIAFWQNNKIFMDTHKYSVTTTKIQNKLRQLIDEYGMEVITND